jgi:hypothetical protein
MARLVTITDGQSTAKFTVSDDIFANDPILSLLVATIRTFRAAVPITFIKCIATGMPNEYLYRWKTVDNRVWKQKLTFTAPGVVWQTFDIPTDKFVEGEFMGHRAMRAAILHAHDSIGLIEVDVTWT